MTVNWTPFLTLFPLRRPAKDIAENEERQGRGLGNGVSFPFRLRPYLWGGVTRGKKTIYLYLA
jgi:hypothetical protein